MTAMNGKARLSSPWVSNPVLVSALGAFVLACLLQVWRPYFFLSDDNLLLHFPAMCGVGRDLAGLRSPFETGYAFGGGYSYLKDVGYLHLWHPWHLLCGWVAAMWNPFAAVDGAATGHLVFNAAVMALFFQKALTKCGGASSTRWIVFLALSYTFSIYALQVSCGWFYYLANMAVPPIVGLAFLDEKRWKGILLVALATVHAVIGGNVGTFILCCAVASPVLIVRSVMVKDAEWVLRWVVGGVVGVFVLMPLLIPACEGFLLTERSEGVNTAHQMARNMPLPVLLLSVFGGMLSGFTGVKIDVYGLGFYGYALAFAGASGLLLPCLFQKKAWTSAHGWCLAGAVLVGLFVVRPEWLAELMLRVPLLRSLRMPYKEIYLLLFFIHLLLVLRPPEVRRSIRAGCLAVGLVLFALVPILGGAPWVTDMSRDRELLLSGEADRLWDNIQSQLHPDDFVVPVGPGEPETLPFVLLGVGQLPEYFEVRSAAGYSNFTYRKRYRQELLSRAHWLGLYRQDAMAELLDDPHALILRAP